MVAYGCTYGYVRRTRNRALYILELILWSYIIVKLWMWDYLWLWKKDENVYLSINKGAFNYIL